MPSVLGAPGSGSAVHLASQAGIHADGPRKGKGLAKFSLTVSSVGKARTAFTVLDYNVS